MQEYRSHTCGELRISHLEANVRLSGWVHRIRNHGGMAFIDLRDNYGITQLVVDSKSEQFVAVETLRVESVIRIEGVVRGRPEGTHNLDMETGWVEVKVTQLDVLNAADELPMPVAGEADYPEDIRLKYRFLDLRRKTLHANILKRTQVIASLRRMMQSRNFTEFATPILTASSPEGARDYLVPSRIHQGKYFALPQAPQQYKQLLMVSGFDKYFQIAPCFRDETPRSDRLPGEFYQLDMEMSFVNQDDLLQTMEPVLRDIFTMYGDGKPVTEVFPRIPYAEAIRRYGSDKPDLRNPLKIHDVTEHFSGSDFKVFADAIENQAEVWAVPAPQGGSRSFTKKISTWAQQQGFIVGEILFGNGEAKPGPIAKHLGMSRCLALRDQLGLVDGDAAFVILGKPMDIYKSAGALRTQVGTELNLIDTERFEFCWIVDFPFYELNDEGELEFAHNPFSMPQDSLDGDPLGVRAYQFDAVCNGFELASGSIRNHKTQTMLEAFAKVGMDREAVETNFGALFDAFRFGAPPHGGMAAGVDRIVMLLCGAKNLREVSLFPMNQQAQDLLMNAPSDPTEKQKKELGLN